ncbi:MAG: AzlC family ABC transporter permease [Rhodospirillaceae bacterium]|nr:AzlC family ABC transporter permease [Rhodospirillaceae bacterium]
MNTDALKHAFKSSLPVMFGYVPLGMAFGVLFQDLGYGWYFSSLMGVFVFAGAAQFMAVGLLAAHAGLVEVAVSTLVLNSRHMFFGLSLLKRYQSRGLKKLYLIFGLTDETYSLITASHLPTTDDEQNYYFYLTALNHFYWVVGCTLGALLGASVEFDSRGMDFALTALFMVLLIEQWKKIQNPIPFVVALSCSVAALWFFPDKMLLVAIVLSTSILLALKPVVDKNK